MSALRTLFTDGIPVPDEQMPPTPELTFVLPAWSGSEWEVDGLALLTLTEERLDDLISLIRFCTPDINFISLPSDEVKFVDYAMVEDLVEEDYLDEARVDNQPLNLAFEIVDELGNRAHVRSVDLDELEVRISSQYAVWYGTKRLTDGRLSTIVLDIPALTKMKGAFND